MVTTIHRFVSGTMIFPSKVTLKKRKERTFDFTHMIGLYHFERKIPDRWRIPVCPGDSCDSRGSINPNQIRLDREFENGHNYCSILLRSKVACGIWGRKFRFIFVESGKSNIENITDSIYCLLPKHRE
jgi:hypothetical protein